MIELDGNGDIVLANFPSFALSDGDKATLKRRPRADGTLRVTMRGDVFDGRGFIKSTMAGRRGEQGQAATRDIDLDVKLGTVTATMARRCAASS